MGEGVRGVHSCGVGRARGDYGLCTPGHQQVCQPAMVPRRCTRAPAPHLIQPRMPYSVPYAVPYALIPASDTKRLPWPSTPTTALPCSGVVHWMVNVSPKPTSYAPNAPSRPAAGRSPAPTASLRHAMPCPPCTYTVLPCDRTPYAVPSRSTPPPPRPYCCPGPPPHQRCPVAPFRGKWLESPVSRPLDPRALVTRPSPPRALHPEQALVQRYGKYGNQPEPSASHLLLPAPTPQPQSTRSPQADCFRCHFRSHFAALR